MNKNYIVGLVASIREKSHAFLESELRQRGIKGIVAAHGSVLGLLYRHGGSLQMAEIAEKIGRSKSTMTTLIATLEKHGYVRKVQNEADRRGTFVVLTDSAWALKPVFEEISAKLIETVYAGFTDAEQDLLMKLLVRVRDNL